VEVRLSPDADAVSDADIDAFNQAADVYFLALRLVITSRSRSARSKRRRRC
jgi:hypothetical protein